MQHDSALGGGITGSAACSLYAALQRVPDGRGKRGRRYDAALVLTLLMLAKLAGEQSIAGIAQWVRERQSLLRQWLPLERTPCANTYRYVCAHVDVQALFAAVTAALETTPLETSVTAKAQHDPPVQAAPEQGTPAGAQPRPLRQLACDGKELRGSFRLTGAGVQAVKCRP